MTKEEFERLSYMHVSDEQFKAINGIYMATNLDKKTFCGNGAFIVVNCENEVIKALVEECEAREQSNIRMNREIAEKENTCKAVAESGQNGYMKLASFYLRDVDSVSYDVKAEIMQALGTREYYKMRLKGGHTLTPSEQAELADLL